jgi:tetratricopeptide (TPR) repeat protein
MPRLNDRAFTLLQAEIQNSFSDSALQVQRELILRRLERLRTQEGSPLSYHEIRGAIVDLLPDFSETVLKAAAKANGAVKSSSPKPSAKPSSKSSAIPWGAIKFSSIALLLLGGGIYVANLPIPALRWSVARSMPILLIPSFMSMDNHYRGAINSVEQADQLINSATAPEDFELGGTKVKEAQRHLEALPVWFVGFYPKRYCSFVQCSWRFTLDEFRSARENVARMEAKLFQEGNARTQLEEKEQALDEAKQAYSQAKDNSGRQKAIAQWQTAIDALKQVPDQTLAGRMSQETIQAAERDFQQVVGFTVDNTRTGNWMEAAREFAGAASKGKSPQSLTELQETKGLWEEAIDRIEKITVDDPDYREAQKQLVVYKQSLSAVEIQMQAEKESVQAFQEAQRLKQTLLAITTNDPNRLDRGRVARSLQEIIDELQKVKQGTTVYTQAQTLRQAAEKRLK